jgi:type IV pilus assembly protein PilA
MPTKLKGMASLEMAIIVAIVLVIAIAVGWYLYTTFAAAGQQSGLVVTSATIYNPGGDATACLVLRVTPQGAASVEIVSIEVAGNTFDASKVTVNEEQKARVTGPATVKVQLENVKVAVGQVVTGRVVLSSGAMSPFTAIVVAGDVSQCQSQQPPILYSRSQ